MLDSAPHILRRTLSLQMKQLHLVYIYMYIYKIFKCDTVTY